MKKKKNVLRDLRSCNPEIKKREKRRHTQSQRHRVTNLGSLEKKKEIGPLR